MTLGAKAKPYLDVAATNLLGKATKVNLNFLNLQRMDKKRTFTKTGLAITAAGALAIGFSSPVAAHHNDDSADGKEQLSPALVDLPVDDPVDDLPVDDPVDDLPVDDPVDDLPVDDPVDDLTGALDDMSADEVLTLLPEDTVAELQISLIAEILVILPEDVQAEVLAHLPAEITAALGDEGPDLDDVDDVVDEPVDPALPAEE